MSTTKAIKGDMKRERERVRKRNRDPDRLPRAKTKTKQNISKFLNPQNPKADIETQTDYPALKESIHMRERESET